MCLCVILGEYIHDYVHEQMQKRVVDLRMDGTNDREEI